MYDRTTTKDTDRELIEVLTAISEVSKRLAFKLERMQAMKTEGGRRNGQNERNVRCHRRTENCGCRY